MIFRKNFSPSIHPARPSFPTCFDPFWACPSAGHRLHLRSTDNPLQVGPLRGSQAPSFRPSPTDPSRDIPTPHFSHQQPSPPKSDRDPVKKRLRKGQVTVPHQLLTYRAHAQHRFAGSGGFLHHPKSTHRKATLPPQSDKSPASYNATTHSPMP